MYRVWACALGALLIAGKACADVSGAGASFPSNVYSKWADRFRQEQGVAITYRPTGSGDGVKQISEHTVQFGGSDSPVYSCRAKLGMQASNWTHAAVLTGESGLCGITLMC